MRSATSASVNDRGRARADVQRPLEHVAGEDGHGEDRLVLVLAQVRERLEAGVEVRARGEHDRPALGGCDPGDPDAPTHPRRARRVLDPRAMGRAQHELVGALVVEVDEAGVRLERSRDLVGDRLEHLLQVERRVDDVGRPGQEGEMACSVVHVDRAVSPGRQDDRPEHGHGDREPEVEPADEHEAPPGRRRGRVARAELPLQPRSEDVVVEQAADDEQRDQHGLEDERPVEIRVERRAVEAAVPVGEPEPGEDRHRHRAPPDRAPAATERPHGRRARLALELPDRRHADEDERHGAPDPDAGRQHVQDPERGHHLRSPSSTGVDALTEHRCATGRGRSRARPGGRPSAGRPCRTQKEGARGGTMWFPRVWSAVIKGLRLRVSTEASAASRPLVSRADGARLGPLPAPLGRARCSSAAASP